MSDIEYSLTGQDILGVIQGMSRQKAEAQKIAQVYHLLRGSLTGEVPADIEQKINQVLLGIEQRERSLSDEVREWVMTTTGNFLTTDVHKDLELTTRGDKKNLVVILERLRKEGVIDRHGDKRGCYRLRDSNLDAMNIINPSGVPLDIQYPLYLDALFVTLPRNIIVIAGEPDSGKTAFLLNFVKLNMEAFEIHYFNSEMGEMELRSRLSKFGAPCLQDFQKVHWWERSSDFADVIQPDAVNVVDFLEITEDFWKIGTWIKQIHDRLRKGIAVIAIQKKRGAELGRGGQGTLEKPRLYLAMAPNRATIVKCKNWKDEEYNPNGQELTFKLIKGCEFRVEKLWEKPEQSAPLKKARSYRDFVAEGSA